MAKSLYKLKQGVRAVRDTDKPADPVTGKHPLKSLEAGAIVELDDKEARKEPDRYELIDRDRADRIRAREAAKKAKVEKPTLDESADEIDAMTEEQLRERAAELELEVEDDWDAVRLRKEVRAAAE